MGAVGAHGEEFVSWEIPDIANRKMRRTYGAVFGNDPALADWAKVCRAAGAFRKGSQAEQETAQQGSSTVSETLPVQSVKPSARSIPMIVAPPPPFFVNAE